ncbi:MAG TPA: diaminopimelate epimerase, partial [Tepidisphaeraceae bacterium]
GVRCVAKYAFDHGLSRSNPMKVETGRGVLTLELHTANGKAEQVTVNMGHPILNLPDIPVDTSKVVKAMHKHEYTITLSENHTRMTPAANVQAQEAMPMDCVFVSMGNPHAVTFVHNVESPNLNYLGPLVEYNKAFPRRINAHWVQVITPQEVIMRTWERGSGITMACGTGACAVCVSGVLTGRTERKILAHLPGGDLTLEWRESDNNVSMTGPATEVFTGEWKI